MKKLSILVFLLAAVSCETPLFIDPVGPEQMLVLQARLLTSDTLHTVYASYSTHDSLSRATDLTVSCYVNGVRVAETSWASTPEGNYHTKQIASAYRFKADIHPGDSVRIEAEGPKEKAVAKVKALNALHVPEVSMEKISKQDNNGRESSCFRFTIRVQDEPGQRNWYRMACSSKQVMEWYAPGQHFYGIEEDGWIVDWEREAFIQVDNTRDPLLNPGGQISDEHQYQGNEYNFFTDELFEDKSTVLTLDAYALDYFLLYSGWQSTSVDGIMYNQHRVYHTAYFDLQNMSREDFIYNRLLGMHHFSLGGVNFIERFFSEDIALPQNVEGGLGFVTVRTVSRAVVDLGVTEFTDYYPDYNYDL